MIDDKIGVAIIGIWVAWALFCLTITGGVIYAAIHFIHKLW